MYFFSKRCSRSGEGRPYYRCGSAVVCASQARFYRIAARRDVQGEVAWCRIAHAQAHAQEYWNSPGNYLLFVFFFCLRNNIRVIASLRRRRGSRVDLPSIYLFCNNSSDGNEQFQKPTCDGCGRCSRERHRGNTWWTDTEAIAATGATKYRQGFLGKCQV